MSLEDRIKSWADAGRRRLIEEAKRRIREKPAKMSRLGIDGNLVLTESGLERAHLSRGNSLPKEGKIVPLDEDIAYLGNNRSVGGQNNEGDSSRSISDSHMMNAGVASDSDDTIFPSVIDLGSVQEIGPDFNNIGWVSITGARYKNVNTEYVHVELPKKHQYTTDLDACCTPCIDPYGEPFDNCWSLYTVVDYPWSGVWNENIEGKFNRSYEVDVVAMTLSDKTDRYSPYNENKYTGTTIDWFHSTRESTAAGIYDTGIGSGWLYQVSSIVREGCNTGCPPNMTYHQHYQIDEFTDKPSEVFEANPRFVPAYEMVYSADHENVYYAWIVSRTRNNQLSTYPFYSANMWSGNYGYVGIGPDTYTVDNITEIHYMTHNYRTGATSHTMQEVFNQVFYSGWSSTVPGDGKHSWYLEGYTFPWDGTSHDDWWQNMQPGSLHYELKDTGSNYKYRIVRAITPENGWRSVSQYGGTPVRQENLNGYTYDRINGALYKTTITPDYDHSFGRWHRYAQNFDVWFRWVPPDPNFEDDRRSFYSTIVSYGLEEEDIQNWDPATGPDNIYGWRKIRDNQYNIITDTNSLDLLTVAVIPQYHLDGSRIVMGEESNPYSLPGEE